MTNLWEEACQVLAGVQEHPAAAGFPGATCQFRVEGEMPFLVTLEPGRITVRTGERAEPGMTFEGDAAAWREIFAGRLGLTEAYLEDRVFFGGLAPWRGQISAFLRLIGIGSQGPRFWEIPA